MTVSEVGNESFQYTGIKMMQSRESGHPSVETRDLVFGKKISILIKDHGIWNRKKIVYNPATTPQFHSFLNEITERTKQCVRCIFTPDNGSRVTELSQIQEEKSYVCCETGRFQRPVYSQIKDPYSPRHGRGRAHKIDPLGFRRLNNLYSDVQPRYLIQEPSHRPEKYIFVYENHNDVEKPRKVLLYNCSTMNKVIYDVHNVIAEDIKDTVRGLWDMDGVEITEPSMLENGGYYVAKGSRSPNDEFATNCHYRPAGCRPFDVPAHSPRDSNPYKGVSYMWQLPGNSAKRPRTLPHIHQSRVKKPSPDHSHHSEPQSQRRSNRQVLDPIQQQQNRTKKKKADYDKDDGGVFKAKGQNKYTRGANEVNDSRNMKVDLPIDQVRAEEVQEEKIRKEKQSKEADGNKANIEGMKPPTNNALYGPGTKTSPTATDNSQGPIPPTVVNPGIDPKNTAGANDKDADLNKKTVDTSKGEAGKIDAKQVDQKPAGPNVKQPAGQETKQQLNDVSKTKKDDQTKTGAEGNKPVTNDTKKVESGDTKKPPAVDTNKPRPGDSSKPTAGDSKPTAVDPSKPPAAGDTKNPPTSDNKPPTVDKVNPPAVGDNKPSAVDTKKPEDASKPPTGDIKPVNGESKSSAPGNNSVPGGDKEKPLADPNKTASLNTKTGPTSENTATKT